MNKCELTYGSLAIILDEAFQQAKSGKGHERHASKGESFKDQPICEMARRLGHGGPLYQAVKKIFVSQGLEGERGVHELLGAINYIAAAIIVRREGGG